MTSQRVKNKKCVGGDKTLGTRLGDVFCDLLQYTRTEKRNLFVMYNKNSNGLYIEEFGGMKREQRVCKRGYVCHANRGLHIKLNVTNA